MRSDGRLAALIATLSAAAGCRADPMGVRAGSPVSAQVTVSPAPQALGVSPTAGIEVWFNAPMDSASCVARFRLHMGDSSGPVVPGHLRWDGDHRHMTFLPDSMMAPGTRYFAHMRDSMMTRDSMMRGSIMGGGGMMGGGQHLMPGRPMMFDQPPVGATRTGDGMMWSFTTGS